MSYEQVAIRGGAATNSVRPSSEGQRDVARLRAAATVAAKRTEEAAPAAAAERSASATTRMVRDLVESSNETLATLNHQLRFRVHEETGQLMVQVVDFDNGEVLRQQGWLIHKCCFHRMSSPHRT